MNPAQQLYQVMQARISDQERELSLLLRLLEPYEQDGTLSERVPGLATLNGIRVALGRMGKQEAEKQP